MIERDYRRSVRTEKKLKEVRQEIDVKKALEGLVDLFNNYTNMEEKVPVKYDKTSGKPVKFKWCKDAVSKFYPVTSHHCEEIVLEANLNTRVYRLGFECLLSRPVVERLVQGDVLINTKFGKYIFYIGKRKDSCGKEILIRKIGELK